MARVPFRFLEVLKLFEEEFYRFSEGGFGSILPETIRRARIALNIDDYRLITLLEEVGELHRRTGFS